MQTGSCARDDRADEAAVRRSPPAFCRGRPAERRSHGAVPQARSLVARPTAAPATAPGRRPAG